MPERIQLRRTKGWRMPPNTVKVARPGPWGNPHTVAECGDAETAVNRFRCDVVSALEREETPQWVQDEFRREEIEDPLADPDEWLRPLRGKNLACWCALDQPCHADVLLEIANA